MNVLSRFVKDTYYLGSSVGTIAPFWLNMTRRTKLFPGYFGQNSSSLEKMFMFAFDSVVGKLLWNWAERLLYI